MIKKKNVLKNKLVVMLCSFILLIGCNQEEDITFQDFDIQPSLKISLLSKEHFQQNEKLIKKINVINALISEKRRDPIYSDEYNMTIETDFVELVENEDGSIQSYTFPISREIDNGLVETFVLTLQEDEAYKAHYIAYNITDQELLDISNGQQVDIIDRTQVIEVEDEFLINEVLDTREGGYWVYQAQWVPVYGTNMFFETVIRGYVLQYSWVWIPGSNPLGDTNGGIADNADGTGTNTGGASGSAKPYSRPTDPSIVSYNAFKQRYAQTLDRNQTNLLEENPFLNQNLFQYLDPNNFSDVSENTALELLAYLGEDPNSQELTSFVFDIINYLIENNDAIEIVSNDSNDPTIDFNSIEDMESFFDNFLNGDEFTNYTSEQETPAKRRDISSVHFSSFPQTEIISIVRIELPHDTNGLVNPEILSMETMLEGNNMFYEWTQTSSSDPEAHNGPFIEYIPEPTDPTRILMRVSIIGRMKIGLIRFGPVEFRRIENRKIVMLYDNETGDFLNGHMEPID